MFNLNTLLALGITGLAVTVIMHIVLKLSTDITLGTMMAYYPVWIAFLVIGIAKQKKSYK